MFTLSVKVEAKKIIACCVALCVVTGGFCGLKAALNKKAVNTSATVSEAVTKMPKLKVNDDRLQIAQMLGWEVENEPMEIEEIIIPEKFDEVYSKYNDLQKSMGFDLEKYKGDKCKRYAYKIKNFDGEDDVVLNMIVHKDKLIGGDVSSRQLGGFMTEMQNTKQIDKK